ncbi:hypothetical protein BDZ89DRAFT_1070529 [Hymenopellis radicata]|nr:hypothetical protein BDZ89DRAFT_1070529 [Hymenopellis radicata]
MKLIQVFTALATLTYISTVQAGYCYCVYLSEADPILSSTKYVLLSLPGPWLSVTDFYRQCCLDVTGTDTLQHVFLGADIYCDTGVKTDAFEQCCKSKGESLYCR